MCGGRCTCERRTTAQSRPYDFYFNINTECAMSHSTRIIQRSYESGRIRFRFSNPNQTRTTLIAGYTSVCINSRFVRAIPWPSGRWRARRRIDTGPAGRLHNLERARGHVQPRSRSEGRLGRGEGCHRRLRSGGSPPASRDTNERGRYSARQRTCARRTGRSAWRTGGLVEPTARDGAPLTTPLDGVRNRRRVAATIAGSQARSPAGHDGRVGPRKSLRAVSGNRSGRWGGSGRQGPPGTCDHGCRTVLFSHVTQFAFSVIATLPTLTCPQIPEN